MTKNILEIHHLKKYFPVPKHIFGKTVDWVHAVDDISFSLARGKTLGLVGESGCGKSTTGRVILRLIEPDSGDIIFNGKSIVNLRPNELRPLRRDMQLIFQDPFSSLNPRLTVSEIIEENLIVHQIGTKQERLEMIEQVLTRVGIRLDGKSRYPHEFSGGQRQRIGIARSLVLNPKLIIADEPVSALDVSIQAQVLNLMVEIQEEYDISYLVIAHDLSVVEHLSDFVAVMYVGQIVELASDKDIYTTPKHPYTQFLLEAIPNMKPGGQKKRTKLKGEVPSPISPLPGCRFFTRCPKKMKICKEATPQLKKTGKEHWVACHL